MLRWVDGFDFTSATGSTNSGSFEYHYYFNNGFFQGSYNTGRYADTGLFIANTAFDECIISKVFETRDEWIVGFDLTWTTTLVPNVSFLVFYDTTVDKANAQLGLRFNLSGQLELVRGGLASPTVLGSGSEIFTGGTGGWKYVEIKVKIHNTLGSWEVRVNDVLDFSGTGDTQNTGTAGANIIALRNENFSTNAIGFDNFYIADTQGSINNTFLGPVRMDTYWPVADDTVAFTPSAGANFECVDDQNHASFGDGADYNTPSISGDTDLFDVETIGNNGPIIAVSEIVFANRTAGMSFDVQTVVESGGVEYYGTTYTPLPKISTGYGANPDVQAVQVIYETNPNTSGTWTPSDANSCKYGYKAV